MFNWLRRLPQSQPGYLTYSQHYDQTSRKVPGRMQVLTLIHATMDGLFINLVYQWKRELTDAEADDLDTRARAYIACAIYDAATAAGLTCQPGPPHGQRPSWYIRGERMPISLVEAGFDMSDKTCIMRVGPGVFVLERLEEEGRYCKKLVAGFQGHFAEIRV